MASKSIGKPNTGSRKTPKPYKPSTAKQMNDAHNKRFGKAAK